MALDSPFRAPLADLIAESLSAPIPTPTARRVHGAVTLAGKATAVVGMRRAGKTTYLHRLRRERLDAGVPKERLLHVGFEDERLAGLRGEDLGLLLEEYYRRVPAARRREEVTLCLDEIQVVPGWDRFVRRVLDTERVEIFISGSSAALLSREIATSLRGRAWEVVLHPFSFEEALAHRSEAVPPEDATGPRERSLLESAFLGYLARGGFPEVQRLDVATSRQLLRDYVDVAMLRDVVERHAVTNVAALRWLVRHLLGNAASSFSVEKFFAALKSQGLRVSKDTVHHLLAYLEDCFLVRTVSIESRSERQRMVNPRKVYPVDPGLIPVFDRTGDKNVGHALETVVLLELERRRSTISYVKTAAGREVDFLARAPDGTMELIQVCADASAPETAERELRALEEAGARFPEATLRLLVATEDGRPKQAPRAVEVEPAYRWLLREPVRS